MIAKVVIGALSDHIRAPPIAHIIPIWLHWELNKTKVNLYLKYQHWAFFYKVFFYQNLLIKLYGPPGFISYQCSHIGIVYGPPKV